MVPEIIEQHMQEIEDKIKRSKSRSLSGKNKKKLLMKLKLSSLAMVPHKSRLYRAILDLSFILKLAECDVPLVNDTTKKMA